MQVNPGEKLLNESDKVAHIASDFCVPCGNVKRSFEALCKQQGTLPAMTEMKKDNLAEWVSVLRKYRDQRGGRGKRSTFDSTSFVEYHKKSNVFEDDNVFKKLLLGEYVRYHQSKAPPFTLTEAQATAQWHKDLADPGVKKSTVELYNPLTKKIEEFTRVHVLAEELEHRKHVEEHGKEMTKTSTTKAPTEAVLKEYGEKLQSEDKNFQQAFMAGEADLACKFEDDDETIKCGRSNRKQKKPRTGSGGGGSDGKIPKIQDLAVVINSKVTSLLPRIETAQNALRSVLLNSMEEIESHTELLAKYRDLVDTGISESQIDQCIKNGTDPYNLERQKSLYKCMFQFAQRARLVSFMIGKSDMLGGNLRLLKEPITSEQATNDLRALLRPLACNPLVFFASCCRPS